MPTRTLNPHRDPATGLVPQEYALDVNDPTWGDGKSIVGAEVEHAEFSDVLIATTLVRASERLAPRDSNKRPMPGWIAVKAQQYFQPGDGQTMTDVVPEIVDWFTRQGIVAYYAQQLAMNAIAVHEKKASSAEQARKIAGFLSTKFAPEEQLALVEAASAERFDPKLAEARARADAARADIARFLDQNGPAAASELRDAIRAQKQR